MPRHNFTPKVNACSAPGCANNADHNGKGGFLCDSHYQRLLKRGTLEARTFAMKSQKPEYRHWINMKSRCNTASSTGFERYGGRGIQVCPEWNASFDAFYRDMGPRPAVGYSVERIDVEGNYEPGNCCWATPKQQSRNIRSNHLVEVMGELVPVSAAAEQTGLKPNTIIYRLRRGWSDAQAISRPPRKGVRPNA